MKKLIVSGLLLALILPASALAIGEVLTEDQSTTNNWCNANYPALGLTRANDGLICDVLTARENMKKVIQLLQQLLALRQQLQALLDRGNTPPPVTPPVTPPQANNKIKVDITGIKANYNIGENITFNIVARKKENGPSTLNFTGCQVKFQIAYESGNAKPIVYNSLTAQSCPTATSTVTLPNTWAQTFTNTLQPGQYRLSAEVIGYGKATDWHFNIKRPGEKSLSLTQPTGNVVWEKGEDVTIKWTSGNTVATDKVDIVLVSPSAVYSNLVAATANDGEQEIEVPESLVAGTHTLFLRLTGTSINSQYSYVTIQAEGEEDAPFISSLSPSKGATTTEVVVNGSGFTDSNTLKFGTYTIGTNLVSAESGTKISFVVPASIPTVGNYAVVVSNDNGTSNSVNFTVVKAGDEGEPPAPVETKIEVTAPSTNNEPWTIGATKDITWESTPTTGAATKVNIRLINVDTNQVQDIKLNADNNESYSWKVGELANGTTAAAGKYKFRVCPVGLGDCDRGDNNVKIVAAASASAQTGLTASAAASLQLLIEQLNQLLRAR